MKLLALTLLLSMAAEASRPYPLALPRGCRDRGCVRERVITPYVPAYFEFAPASGAGMGAACACTTPTGAKGEAMTFARASSATCLVRSTVTGIQNGDMKTCATNQPRIMPGGDGTGPLGLLSELARTNVLVQSQAITDAGWVNFVAGNGANPIRGAADTDVSPGGTMTAERVTFGSTLGDAGDSSGLSQTVLTAAAYSGSILARDTASVLDVDGGNVDGGNVGGTFDLCLDTSGAATCVSCGYVVGSWSQCLNENVTSKASGKYYIGNLSSLNGGTRRPQQIVTLFGAQAEAGPDATSYIATDTTSATRAIEKISTPLSWTWPTQSFAMTLSTSQPTANAPTAFRLVFDASNRHSMSENSTTWRTNFFVAGASKLQLAPATIINRVFERAAGYYDGTNVGACLNGTCAQSAQAFSLPNGSGTLVLGMSDTPALNINGVIKQFCIDPDPMRCR